MKTNFLKSIFVFVMMAMALPMVAQDWMEVHFKDGTYRKFYMKYVTEIVASKTDGEVVTHDDYDYQRIVTDYDVFTYLISDIENISFTKYNEEEARQNFVEATNAVFDVLHANPTLEDVEGHIDVIKNAEGVEDAWTDGHELFVKIEGYGVTSFHFSHRVNTTDDNAKSNTIDVNRIKKLVSPSKVNMLSSDSQLKAVILKSATNSHAD